LSPPAFFLRAEKGGAAAHTHAGKLEQLLPRNFSTRAANFCVAVSLFLLFCWQLGRRLQTASAFPAENKGGEGKNSCVVREVTKLKVKMK
jgi:hypothetical protein